MPRLRVTLREVEVDFRPTPVRGEGPFFVSRTSLPRSCGALIRREIAAWSS